MFNAFTQDFQQRVVLTRTGASPIDGILTLDFYPYLNWGGKGRSYAYINGITVTAIPEPASLLLMASGRWPACTVCGGAAAHNNPAFLETAYISRAQLDAASAFFLSIRAAAAVQY